ncbi:uncharacterized protein [Primulina huaijiensis]|uniref:uncharacterized protein n=1 Tax=Primulina huaijiensis TaxID=1492673 RepID=UPI003CC76ABD
MNALDSPVEPLALNYLSYSFFTAVNKMLAAWVAAVTTAFSFWRIGPSSPPRPEQRGRTKDAASTSLLDRGLEELAVADEPAELVSTQGGTYCISSLETENSTKGKFVLYYRNDDFREGGVEDDDGVAAKSEKFRRWSDMDWEGKMKIRMGDMGWYRCQDLAAFNGSVVRLWDGRSRVCATDR